MPRKLPHFYLHSSSVPLAKKCHPSEILFLLQEMLSLKKKKKKAPSVTSGRGKYTDLDVSTLGFKGESGIVSWAECLCPPKFICSSPNPRGDGLRRWSLWEVIKLRQGHKSGAPTIRLVSLQEERERELNLSPSTHAEESEDTGRRWPSPSRDDGPHQEPNQPTPCLDFQPPEL